MGDRLTGCPVIKLDRDTGAECIPIGTLFIRRGPYMNVVGNTVSSVMS